MKCDTTSRGRNYPVQIPYYVDVRMPHYFCASDSIKAPDLPFHGYGRLGCSYPYLFRTLPIIHMDSTGPYVKLLQQNLLGLGYVNVPVDGVFGNKTLAAVHSFQDRFDLISDGIVGPVTWKLLLDNVKAVQKLLNSYGYSAGSPDGFFGPKTTHALQQFQQSHELYVSGIVDPRTRRKLFNLQATDHVESRLTSRDISSLNLKVAAMAKKFLDLTREYNLDIRITDAFRSWSEQDELYAQGRWEPGNIVTNARGGESYHNWGLAFDAAPVENGVITYDDEEKFKLMGRLGQQAGLEWGGTFKKIRDYPHFQYTFGLSIWDLLNGVQPPRNDK